MKRKTIGRQLTAAVLCAGMLMSQGAGALFARAAEDPVEISIAIWGADEYFSGDEVLTEIEDKLNIKITPMNVSWDDYTEKIQLWSASGSLPDVFVGDLRNTVTYPQWAQQGVIHAIPDDLSAYPNLAAYLDGQSAEEAKIGGTLYCIPRATYPSQEWTCMDRVISYRWDLAQAAGVEKEPENWEEFKDMMLKIMEADPDGTGVGGMTALSKDLLAGIFLSYASPIAVQGGASYKWVLDEEDGLFKPLYFVEDMIPAFQLARDLYDSGVIEQDIALTTNQSAEEKFLQGKSAAIVLSGGYGKIYQSVSRYWEEVHGSDYLDDVKALNLMPDQNGNLTYPMWGYAWSESYINASVSDEKLDRILALFDYLLTDEGVFLSIYGPEGALYELEDGKVHLFEDAAVIHDTYPSTNAFAFMVRWAPDYYDDRFVSTTAPKGYEAVNRALVDQAVQVEIPEYNQRCTELVMELGLDFSINLEDDFLNLMTGTEPVEEMWAEVVKEYEADGLWDTIYAVNDALAED